MKQRWGSPVFVPTDLPHHCSSGEGEGVGQILVQRAGQATGPQHRGGSRQWVQPQRRLDDCKPLREREREGERERERERERGRERKRETKTGRETETETERGQKIG